MRRSFPMAAAAFASVLTLAAAQTASKTKTPSKTAATTSAAKTGAAKTGAAKASTTKTPAKAYAKSSAAAPRTGSSAPKKTTAKASSKSGAKAGAKQTATAYRRSLQQQPTPDRYREIQQALSDKGYFGGPVDGNWGPDSVEALKRFQHDQSLTDDGKIGSLSLIALGLGPKRDAPAAPPDRSAP